MRHSALAICGQNSRRVAARPSLRAFTLMELMIVVVIIGVLASIAVYSLNTYLQRSKVSEAREVVGQIMSAQEAYFDEVGSYMDVTGGMGDDNFYPAGGFDGRTMIQWGGSDGCSFEGEACSLRFARLGISAGTPVRFRYAATTMAAGESPPIPTTHVSASDFNPGDVTAPRAGYSVVALSDLSPGGEMTSVIGTSLQAQLYVGNAGD